MEEIPKKCRKSVTIASRLPDYPLPSKKERKKWKPVINLCIYTIASHPPRSDNKGKKHTIMLKIREGSVPKDFPLSIQVLHRGKGYVVAKYSPERLLCWLYERWLADITPNDIYKGRQSLLTGLKIMENHIDVDIDEKIEYSFCFD